MVLMLTAEYFKERRLERGLSVEEVAERLGCKRLRKAVRRVKAFEDAGYVRAALLGRLATVLGIDETTLNRLAFDDYRYWFRAHELPRRPVPSPASGSSRRGGPAAEEAQDQRGKGEVRRRLRQEAPYGRVPDGVGESRYLVLEGRYDPGDRRGNP